MSKTVLTVKKEDAGQRLDSFLARLLEGPSRSQIQKWIASGYVMVEGTQRRSSYALEEGDRIEVDPPPPEPSELIAEDLPISILYEDEALLVVNKPAGMVVHPGAGNLRGTLANALAYHLETLSRTETARPGLVHRLDKGTSGVLLIAKNEVVHERLSRQFKERRVRKVYIALLHGLLSPRTGEIDLPIGRDRFSRTRMSPRTTRPRGAVTRYDVVRYYRDFTLVRAFPITGRTHQIRVHFQHRGHPIVGDETYGGENRPNPLPDRLFLHATMLELEHPTTGEHVRFEAALPAELAEFLRSLGE